MPTINGDDYWHLFSLRNERIVSFTESTDVNKKDNFNANHFSFQQQRMISHKMTLVNTRNAGPPANHISKSTIATDKFSVVKLVFILSNKPAVDEKT
jgi:hypothetical protein